MRISDWSSDVCSSDLDAGLQLAGKIATLQCINPDSALFAWCRNASKDQPMSASSPHRIAAAPVKAVGKALAVVVLLVVAACAAEPTGPAATGVAKGTALPPPGAGRTEESRGGEEGGRTCRTRWSP